LSEKVEITLAELHEAEVIAEIRSVLDVITHSMVIPLYLMFWVADLIYIPKFKWIFLLLRLTIVPICFIARYDSRREQNAQYAQILCCVFVGLVALPINIMIYFIPDIGTGYYAGLNLVAIGGLSFIPFSMNFFIAATFAIYFPYYLVVFSKAGSLQDVFSILFNSFFIVGSIIICFVIRIYHEKLRLRDIDSRLALRNEIANRQK
jgi:hypothetical protein